MSEFAPLSGGATGLSEVANAYFADGACADLAGVVDDAHEPFKSLYRGAAAACFVAAGDTSRWPEVEGAVAALATDATAFDCIDRPIYETMVRLVQVHQRHPHAVIKRSAGRPMPDPCPSIREVSPDHGSRTADNKVTFRGENLRDGMPIHVGDRVVELQLSGRTGSVVVPATADRTVEDVPIWPEGWPGQATNTAFFRYDD
jgi:hypothetical protein